MMIVFLYEMYCLCDSTWMAWLVLVGCFAMVVKILRFFGSNQASLCNANGLLFDVENPTEDPRAIWHPIGINTKVHIA